MMTVDTRGKLCPLPLILFRKAVKENPDERNFEILTDNKISCANLMDFIHQNAYTYTMEEQAGDTTLLRVTIPETRPMEAQEVPCPTPTPRTGKSIVQLRSDVMGQGDDGLGGILILAYLNALKELDRLPSHIICYNSAVKLATRAHQASATLLELQDRGVEVIVCGTCTGYYDVTEEIAVGKISNMLSIAELLHGADTIITP